ncbi:hypothetical protein EDD86DRAFT_185720 [Gorgonomyces haynaldii]|nr:hypothetical protein EDD86DRAFT_185720 [Gorgonomyces haynaldii]
MSVLVYGGCGNLGKTIVSRFKQSNFTVLSVDFRPNDEAHHNIILQQQDFLATAQHIESHLSTILGDQKLDALLNVAGGWAGGNLLDPEFLSNVDLMYRQSVQSSAIAGRLSALFLKPGGLLVLTGASAATHGTPGMIGYGMAKASVHQLVKSCAGPNSGLPAGSKVCAILPITIDTPMNRKFMPDADFSTWTPMEAIAERLHDWTVGKESVESGETYRLVTEKGVTQFVPVV